MNTSWPTLTEAVFACEKCRLCQTRTNVVLGEGDLHAPAGGRDRPPVRRGGGASAGSDARGHRAEAGAGLHLQHRQVQAAAEPRAGGGRARRLHGLPAPAGRTGAAEGDRLPRFDPDAGAAGRADAHYARPGRLAAQKGRVVHADVSPGGAAARRG